MSVPERDASEWLKRAQNDLLNIRNNLPSAQVPWDTVVFHAQQVCEKLLKAIVANDGQSAPRTQLLSMCSKVESADPTLPTDMDRLMLLFGSRYPDAKSPTEAEGRVAVSIAEKMMRIVPPMLKARP